MKARFVNELAEGSRVDSTFVLRSKEMRAARNGEAYLALEFADRSGCIPGVHFKPGPRATASPVGSVVLVSGTVTKYRGVKRVSVETMLPAESWAPEDFLASGTRSVDELKAEFTVLVRSVNHAGLRGVLRSVFGRQGFLTEFSACPASQAHHHAYLGGLLEHTVSVAGQCADLADRYEGVDRDLLVAAALLHDIGKVDELEFDTAITFTDEGRLLGHVVLGLQRVREAMKGVSLDAQLALRLEHALLSHHGELEWGSPKRPSTLEALLLHHVDNLDAKAQGLSRLLAGAIRAEEEWTDASNLFRRPLFAPRPAEDDRPGRVDEEDAPTRLSA